MDKYQIAIDKKTFEVMLSKTVDKGNVSHPSNGFLDAFEEKITKHEGITIELINNMSRIYKGSRRKNTKYCTLNVTCKDCPCKYQITLDDEPDLIGPAIVFNVERFSNHQGHTQTQIRGAENRDEVAKEIIVKCSGSAQAYALRKESRGEEAFSEEVS